MKSNRWIEHKDLFINIVRPIIHWSTILLLYLIGYYVRLITDGVPWRHLRIPSIDSWELIIFASISAIAFIIIGIVKKRYTLTDIGITSNSSFIAVRAQWIIILICLAYFWQWFLFPYGISRLIIGRVALWTIFLIPSIDLLWVFFSNYFLKKSKEKILVLYRSKSHYENISNHKRPEYSLITYQEYDTEKWEGDITSFSTIILVWNYDKDSIQRVFDKVRLHHQQLYHIADNHFLEDVSYETSKIGSMITLRYRATELEGRAIIAKRLFDTVVSFIALILLSPIFIIVGICIKIDSAWPVFYKQLRIGRNIKPFTFIKFRTMYIEDCIGDGYGWSKARQKRQLLINSDKNVRKGVLQKIQGDPRITRVGSFLRKTSIDELPSLRNVLMGQMSLVWPRPHMPHEIEQYQPRHKRVLSVKPGITGYAQIHGRDTISFDEEAEKELLYLQNRSIFLDLYIILATASVLFVRKGR